MIIKKTMLLALAGLIVGIGASGAASASCSKYGKVEQVYQSASYAYIYVKPLTYVSSSTYHYCWTNDRDLIIAAHAAKDGNSYVMINGGISSCPSGSGSLSSCQAVQRY